MHSSSDQLATGYMMGRDSGGGYNNGMGWGGDWFWGIILIALLFNGGWGNGGWGGFGGGNANGFLPYAVGMNGALTRSDLCAEFNANDLQNAVRGVQQGICDSTFALNNTVVNGFNGVSRDMCTGFANVTAGINENRFAAQQCCCDTIRAIDNSRFDTQTGFNALSNQLASCCCETNRAIERGFADTNYNLATQSCAIQSQMANNTRDIIDSQQAGTRAILDYLCQEKISDLQNENQALRLAASQERQNNYLVNTLRPMPQPSYTVCNPFTGTYGFPGYGSYGYNNNCGCGCGCN